MAGRRQRGEDRRQIFRLVDDNGLIKSAAPSTREEDLPRSYNVAATPTPISLLPLNKTNWLTSLFPLRPVSFDPNVVSMDSFRSPRTTNLLETNLRRKFAQRRRGKGLFLPNQTGQSNEPIDQFVLDDESIYYFLRFRSCKSADARFAICNRRINWTI